jgi:hypothetical protein
MYVSIAVILTMASQSALNQLINPGLTKPSPKSPNLEADVVAVVRGGGRNGHDKRGCGRGSGPGCGDGNKANPRGKWKSNAKAVNAVTTSGGIGKHKGKWSMMCKSCGWNTTHTT